MNIRKIKNPDLIPAAMGWFVHLYPPLPSPNLESRTGKGTEKRDEEEHGSGLVSAAGMTAFGAPSWEKYNSGRRWQRCQTWVYNEKQPSRFRGKKETQRATKYIDMGEVPESLGHKSKSISWLLFSFLSTCCWARSENTGLATSWCREALPACLCRTGITWDTQDPDL